MCLHIMGAGAMGCLWAAHLHCSTQQKITFIDSRAINGQHQSPKKEISFAIRSSFLNHIPDNKTLNFKLTNRSTTQLIEVLFVCTKSFDALPGLNSISHAITDQTIIVLFQNGLGSQHNILDAFPNNPIYAAVTTEGANKDASGKIIHAGKGLTRLGPLSTSAKEDAISKDLLNCMQSNMTKETLAIQYEADIWAPLWHKLAVNCAINPYTAILNCPNGQIRTSQRFIAEWPNLKTELSQLLTAAEHPLSEEDIESMVFMVMHNTRNNISSMLQDIRTKKQTEVIDINGFAARFLASHELRNDINTGLESAILNLSTQK